MFSDHLRSANVDLAKPLLFLSAGLVIASLLFAMVFVASGQVEKAQLRESTLASARAATAGCFESNRGAALKDCDRVSIPTTQIAPSD